LYLSIIGASSFLFCFHLTKHYILYLN